jgi:hypothetical protein
MILLVSGLGERPMLARTSVTATTMLTRWRRSKRWACANRAKPLSRTEQPDGLSVLALGIGL